MFETLLLAGIIAKPIEKPNTIINLEPKIVKVEKKPPKLTLKQKIAKDVNNCEPTHYISAEDASCLLKPVEKPVRTTPVHPQTMSTGNDYSYLSCTWWTYQTVPRVGGGNGNANQWKYNLLAKGWSVGAPKAGGIGWSGRGDYGHVVAVLDVKGDEVLIRNGNYDWSGNVKDEWVSVTDYEWLF